jgi:L-lactate dehydrogenase complex protein LldG
MSARNNILSRIEKNKPALTALPAVNTNLISSYDDVLTKFSSVLESIGGNVIAINSLEELKAIISEKNKSGKLMVNTIHQLGYVDPLLILMTKEILNGVDTAIIKGEIAVAENGAVWLYESQMINRLLPFICQHLILVIDKKNIVATMHQAYQHIDTAEEGFGVFIAGPSKTADIEQSLVIGAHGARSLTVYVF